MSKSKLSKTNDSKNATGKVDVLKSGQGSASPQMKTASGKAASPVGSKSVPAKSPVKSQSAAAGDSLSGSTPSGQKSGPSGGGNSLGAAKAALQIKKGSDGQVSPVAEKKSEKKSETKPSDKAPTKEKSEKKKKDGQEKTADGHVQGGSGSMVSTLTDSASVVGKIRVPTLIVNPADIPTTRTGSDRSTSALMNMTIGGRRRPSASERRDQAAKKAQRTVRALCIAAIVSCLVLICTFGLGIGLMLALSEQQQPQRTTGTTVAMQAIGTAAADQ